MSTLKEDYFIIRENSRILFEKIIKTITGKKKVVAIIQVRMESTRLPGKALMILGNKPCLQHVIDRVRLSEKIDQVVIATTIRKADDLIIDFVHSNYKDVRVFRGDSDNVYGRVLAAAELYDADIIVDITADCPLVDSFIIDTLVKGFIKEKCHYASNVIHRTWPDGFDVQVYSKDWMKKADKLIMNKEDRTHAGYNLFKYVTQIGSMLNMKTVYISFATALQYTFPKWRLTLDTKDDYKLLNKIFKHFEDISYFGYAEVIDYLLKNHELITKKNLNKE